MRKLMITALLAAAPAGAFAQMLPADLQSIDRDEAYNVNTANGVSADHMVRPHLIGDIKPHTVRVAGRTISLADTMAGGATAAEPAHPGS
jgi:hypothetical protein